MCVSSFSEEKELALEAKIEFEEVRCIKCKKQITLKELWKEHPNGMLCEICE